MTVRFPANRAALRAPAGLMALAAATLLAAASAPPRVISTASCRVAPVPPAPPAPATVEPTLPLRIDVTFEQVERSGGRGRGRVRIHLQAIDEVRDLEIEALHDKELSIPEESSLRRERLRLGRGETRVFLMDIEAREDRDLALRLEATFRTDDGTLLHLGQGVTLQGAKPAPAGRLHLGALEYPALVLDHSRP